MKNFKNFIYEKGSKTIRTTPENYWVASVKNNKIIFDSWDGAIKGRINKFKLRFMFYFKMIKNK